MWSRGLHHKAIDLPRSDCFTNFPHERHFFPKGFTWIRIPVFVIFIRLENFWRNNFIESLMIIAERRFKVSDRNALHCWSVDIEESVSIIYLIGRLNHIYATQNPAKLN
jgi:hypothetical protein